MLGFIGRRLINYTFMLFAATTLAYFLASSFLNPRSNYMTMRPRPPEASIDASLNLANVNDKVPVTERYVIWLRQVALDWNWGRSPQGESVNAAVAYRAVVSVKVVLGATILAVLLGVSIGVASAIRQYRLFDRASNAISAFFLVCPTFVLGLLLVLAGIRFNDAVGVRVFYVTGIGEGGFIDYLQHVALPTLTLTLVGYVGYHFTQRTYLLDTMNADYVRTARAKGLRETLVIWRHGVRNAIIPVVTVVGLQLGYLLGSAVVTETVFAWPGLGRLLVQSILARDFPVVQAAVLIVAITFVLVNILTDLLYGLLDPRISAR